ncbi:MAG: cysteine peptidase family C39 domain-containing protein [Bacilli bacterium]|nr:cysteine peptidase family C39 domain-containing protein [Bacilli bacterium]
MFRVKQRDSNDCAVASLLSIIKYYKGNISYNKLRLMMKCDKSGVSAYDLINTAKKVGFNSYGIKCNYDNLSNVKLPCIAHITVKKYYDHFVVIEKIHNKIYINDPYYGKKKYKRNEFEKIWNNILIILEPVSELSKEFNHKRYYLELIYKYKKDIIVLVIISLITIILSIIGSYYFKSLIDSNKYIVFLTFSIILIIRIILEFIRNKVMIFIDKTIEKDLMYESFNNTLSLQEQYFINRQNGDILSRLNSIDSIKTLIFKIPFLFMIYFCIVVFCSYVLIIIDLNLFIKVFILLILYFIIYLIFYKKNNNMIKSINEEKGYVNGFLYESIDGLVTIRNNNIIRNKNNEFNVIYSNYLNIKNSFNDFFNFQNTLKSLLLYLSFNYILYLSSISLNISNIILFYSLFIMLIDAFRNIFELEEDFSNGLVAINRIDELISTDYEYGYSSSKIESIMFEDVSFAYKNDKYIVNNLNLKINGNDKLLLKGKSGSGKTTIFYLLLKYYEVDKGKIIIGEENINNWNLNSIRDNIYYVSSSEKIFRGTLIDNISFDNKDMSRIDLLLKLVNLEKDINMYIEEDGNNLSLGEKSKLLLCRALFSNRNVLIIDELLSNIGIEEENIILNNIIDLYKNKILIYTSHRNINEHLFNKILNLEKKEVNYENIE